MASEHVKHEGRKSQLGHNPLRPQSANVRESDGSLTHRSPGLVFGNPVRRSQSKQSACKQSSQQNPSDGARDSSTVGLAEVIAKGPSYWQLERRNCQSRDLGHPCRKCGLPLTETGSAICVWKAATFVKRFHQECAASFDGTEGHMAANGYADAWRRSQLSARSVQRTQERQAQKEATRRWPQYPTAGMLWRAGTLALKQEKRDAEGVAAWKRQMAALSSFTQDAGGVSLLLQQDLRVECAICLGDLESSSSGNAVADQVLMLPCDPSHAFHAGCLEPWLQRSFNCPQCRADLRPLLNKRVAAAVAESIRAFHRRQHP